MPRDCYLYKSGDAIKWVKDQGPFPKAKAKKIAEQEEQKVKALIQATKKPGKPYRSYVFRILEFNEGVEAPDVIHENLTRFFL